MEQMDIFLTVYSSWLLAVDLVWVRDNFIMMTILFSSISLKIRSGMIIFVKIV